MKVIIYALAAVLAVPSTLGQHHTRRLGVVNEQAAMSIDMITEALSMQSTAAVEPNEDPVYPVFGKSAKSSGHGGPTPTTSGKGGKSGPTAPSDGSSKSGKTTTSTTQATSPGTTGGTTSGTDATTPGTGSTAMTTGGTDPTSPGTGGTDPTSPGTGGTDPTTPGTGGTNPTTPGTGGTNPTTPLTTSAPPGGCTIDNSNDEAPFSDCSGTMGNNFCCTPTNIGAQGPTSCVSPDDGQPCGKGSAQLDLCAEPPGFNENTPGKTPCDPDTQECCKDANNNGDLCCVPNDLDSVGLSCRIIPDGYCALPEVFRDNGLAVFLLGLILQGLGLFDGNRRNLRSVVDERGMEDIIAKVASLLNQEEGGLEDAMAKVAELGVDADMMNQLVNVIGN